MLAWIEDNGFTAEDLFTELNIALIPDSYSFKTLINVSLDIVRALGLKSIVNISIRMEGSLALITFARGSLLCRFPIIKIFPTLERQVQVQAEGFQKLFITR